MCAACPSKVASLDMRNTRCMGPVTCMTVLSVCVVLRDAS